MTRSHVGTVGDLGLWRLRHNTGDMDQFGDLYPDKRS
jgi:hypothetical protein